ncbi:ribosomal RNA small subunit methyltransferase B [Clostridium tetani]|nr:16S rRNA (cytosine(967)-C(5))-methyltransferase RsmB [Clostridium tetani]AVP53679.1 16S rRNA (cytosine(967)-C(5))-methyltransferase RsmB [Clostridium tetani]KGI38312.1 16S rRNA methyltransferase [Clostridium tetani]KGI40187.1 16S rRNA methyltransferase [Clostridium tetani ATCC 9441]KGI42760.1 16S rRNA methyltransferase [Clostridium tetani]KHO33306.1 16S rRNA methyltransferase [Clostridium tetani]
MVTDRKVAIEVLDAVFLKNAYSNIALNNALNKYKLNEKDKAFITELVYGTIKYRHTIDTILNSYIKKGIKSVDKYVLNILRIGIYQLRYLDKVPSFAAVNECVELGKVKSKGTGKLINGVLRNYIRNKDPKYYDESNLVEKLSFEYSYPKWMIDLFLKQYGREKIEEILKGLNSIPSITVRVNNIKSDYESVWNSLEDNNYNIEEGLVCPEAIRIIKGRAIEKNPLFKEGLITVQDESAMLVAGAMDLEDNMNVMDLCSAPGGKTTHISEIMNNTGKVLAFDIHENKLDLIKQNKERLGVKNIDLILGDGTLYNKKYSEFANRILIDAPCSGLGIIRKKPEIKYTKSAKDLKSIVHIQRKILENGAKYLKKNGILLYSTCTLNKKENIENVKWFLKEFPNFKIEKIFLGNLDNFIYDEYGTLTILPNEYMDGFYIAKFKKQR